MLGEAAAAGKAVAPRVSGANMAALAEEYLIAPSILSADFANLGKEVADVLEAGADTVHFDVMDNHYVPNLTIGPMVCKALKNYGIKAPIDVHMMVSPVDQLINDFADAGADYITFHPEATQHIDRSLGLVRAAGCKSGLVFNPESVTHMEAAPWKRVVDTHTGRWMKWAYFKEVIATGGAEGKLLQRVQPLHVVPHGLRGAAWAAAAPAWTRPPRAGASR